MSLHNYIYIYSGHLKQVIYIPFICIASTEVHIWQFHLINFATEVKIKLCRFDINAGLDVGVVDDGP